MTTSVEQSLLSNVTSNHFFLTPKWKKACLKQLQNFIQRNNAKKNKQYIKNKRLSDNIYSIANL